MDAGEIYRRARGRITELVASLSDDELALPVPACPAWTVRDLAAHLAGVAADARSGRLEGAPGDEWTARQIAEREEAPISDILAEWGQTAPSLEPLMATVPGMSRMAFDALTHEHDLRGAVGWDGPRDDDSIDFVVQRMVGALGRRLDTDGAPALRVRAGPDEWIVGTGEPAATLTAEAYELFRAAFGRRSESQVRAMQWDGDPEPYLASFSVFPMATQDLNDR